MLPATGTPQIRVPFFRQIIIHKGHGNDSGARCVQQFFQYGCACISGTDNNDPPRAGTFLKLGFRTVIVNTHAEVKTAK